ncbi:MAG: hypothetical protein GY719_13120 [bacterium]|nr:hypothetical protein [bacterium]
MTQLEPLQLRLFPGSAKPEARRPPAPPPIAPVPDAATLPVRRLSDDPAGELLRALRRLWPDRIRSLQLTDNRSTIVSARRDHDDKLRVRIHRCFAAAPPEAVAAVVDFLRSRKRSPRRRRALAAIRRHFRTHGPSRGEPKKRRIILRPVGQAVDLRELRDGLNERFFGGKLEVGVTWGRAPSRRRGRRGFSVRLGTYSDRDNVARIHRCLDGADVPRYVVEAVVYHEMLHAAIPVVVENGRRRIHGPELRRRERLYPHHEKAERWIERNVARLVGKC